MASYGDFHLHSLLFVAVIAMALSFHLASSYPMAADEAVIDVDETDPSAEEAGNYTILENSVSEAVHLIATAERLAPSWTYDVNDTLSRNLQKIVRVDSTAYKKMRGLIGEVKKARRALRPNNLTSVRSAAYVHFKTEVGPALTKLRTAYGIMERDLHTDFASNWILSGVNFRHACDENPPWKAMNQLQAIVQNCSTHENERHGTIEHFGEDECILDKEYNIDESHTASLYRALEEIQDYVRDLLFFNKIHDEFANTSTPNVLITGRKVLSDIGQWMERKYAKVWTVDMPLSAKSVIQNFTDAPEIPFSQFGEVARLIKRTMNMMGPRGMAYQVLVIKDSEDLSWHAFGNFNSSFSVRSVRGVDAIVTRFNVTDFARANHSTFFASDEQLQAAADELSRLDNLPIVEPISGIYGTEYYSNSVHIRTLAAVNQTVAYELAPYVYRSEKWKGNAFAKFTGKQNNNTHVDLLLLL